jgi:hypothetical protein
VTVWPPAVKVTDPSLTAPPTVLLTLAVSVTVWAVVLLYTALTDFDVSTVCVGAVATVSDALPELGPKLTVLLALVVSA